MGSSFCLFLLMFLPMTVNSSSSSSVQQQQQQQQQPPLCHDGERSALLQFKQSFSVRRDASEDPAAYPKVESWQCPQREGCDCCSWDGVECDAETGHVIGLHLASACLYGFINSTSSLFRLVHLRMLDLSDNDFNESEIPPGIGQLSRLQSLNLSDSVFSGQVPSQLLALPKLVFLDLSLNPLLQLQNPSLRNMVESLTHLKKLHLKEVNISSTIPNSLSNLSSLTSLHLSWCGLHGEVPMSIFRLPRLESLRVTSNLNLKGYLPEFEESNPLEELFLGNTSFSGELPSSIGNLGSLTTLVIWSCNFTGLVPVSLGQLTQLTILDLSYNSFSGQIPSSFANLSSLTSLYLSRCGLHGEFPMRIFGLPRLESLDVSNNVDLRGYLPEFQESSPLKELYLTATSFSGEIPSSIGNNGYLTTLAIDSCNFTGLVPTSLGQLTRLTILDLSYNSFSGPIPSSLANLTQLTYLDLSDNDFSVGTLAWLGQQKKLSVLNLVEINLNGEIPRTLVSMSRLSILDLRGNQLFGQIPSWLNNLTQLTELYLDHNKLSGTIPTSLFELVNLQCLYLAFNNLNGTVEFNMFSKLKNLTLLQLSFNSLSVLSSAPPNATFPKFQLLGLNSCNLTEFPDFLRNQDELEVLFLSQNKIHSPIPKWMWNISKETLLTLTLNENLLTGFDQLPAVLPWSRMSNLDLASNMLHGSLPVPPPSTIWYSVSRNKLTGEIPSLICNLASLKLLDLSDNNLSGRVPQCLSNLSHSLSVLNIRGNSLHGTIPETCIKGSNLRMIDLSENQLQGQIPRSLANCTMLEQLVLGNNLIDDGFPFWLGSLPRLQVLILRSNLLHGAIGSAKKNVEFSKLRIIDLSHNGFTGYLPSKYFQIWDAMKIVDAEKLIYMEADTGFEVPGYTWTLIFNFSMTIMNKGMTRKYEKIPNLLIAIDLSSNKFYGEIPESIGDPKGLRFLNLSNNALSGPIPTSLANLTVLEAIDLSQNKLSREIPQQLAELTFLEFCNVSHNHLTGPIPQGKQFDTFPNSSFDGNPGLCGRPLSRACESSSPPPPSTSEDGSPSEFDWKIILMGYGSGLVIGVSIGYCLTVWKHEWFVKTLGRRQEKWK